MIKCKSFVVSQGSKGYLNTFVAKQIDSALSIKKLYLLNYEALKDKEIL